MSTTVRDAARDTRREELLTAADRVIRREGAGSSMEAIASEAGITKPVLYRHFGDKAGLEQALAERYTHRLMAAIEPALTRERDPRTRLAATIDAYLALVEEEPQAYRFLVAGGGERPVAKATVEGYVAQVAARVTGIVADQLTRAGLDPSPAAPLANALVGMVRQAGDWWLGEDRPLPRAELVDQLVRFAWDGFNGLGTPQ